MTGAEMAAVFDPVVEDVLALIRAQLDAVAAKGRVCETLLLVGGFAESNYLHDRIRAEFQAKIPVIKRPINPGSAIIQGAVTFGFNPRLIMNRKARKTYGIGTTEEFVEGFHDPKKKIYVCGRAFCDDRFLKFVIHGQDVKIDDVVEHTVCPLRPDQKAVTVTLYSTEDSDPMYVTEDGMHKESSIDLDIGKSTHGTESTILVSLSFGVTSIEVKAKGANFAAEETSCSITGHYEQQ